MTQNRGAILNLLQWQNTPRSGSVGCNRRSTSVKRDFIQENIRNVHLPMAKELTKVSSSQIPELTDAGPSIIERYLSDIGLNQDQATQTEFRNNDSRLDQHRKPTTFNECTQNEIHNNSCADCCSTKSPKKQGEFLRAHEKTGQSDTKMALSEIPIKTSARALSLSKVNVPRASSAKDTQLTRGNLNYIRANANAVSNGCVLDRRSTDKQSKRSSSLQRANFGKLPPYLLRRKKEEEKAAARKKAEERSTTPPGYRRMSEEERGDTLRSLEEAHAKTLEGLTRAPIHMSTNGARNLRARLENRLSDLEEMISVFRKPVVFITLN